MTDPGLPVHDFDSYRPITMSVIGSYNVGELNLPAIFMFLPVTDRVLNSHINLQKKQGKICFPVELNRPGEILSMRFENQVRGIVRSEETKSFPHSIIIDIGTSDRIISMKLSRSLKLNGPRSIAIASEAVTAVMNYIRQIQDNLEFLRFHQELAHKVKFELIESFRTGAPLPEYDEDGQRILGIFRQQIRGYPFEAIEPFMNFMIAFNRNLYTGTLAVEKLESEMVNIQYNLGFTINKVEFYKVMNSPPFNANYNTVKPAAPVNVFYQYTKYDLSGTPNQAKHSIRVNRSGHVRHSGPNLESMKPVYYAFMQRVLQNWQAIQSIGTDKQKLKITQSPRAYSIKEWKQFIESESQLREKILTGLVPIATGEDIKNEPKYEPIVRYEQIEHPFIQNGIIAGNVMSPVQQSDARIISFDYAPLVQV